MIIICPSCKKKFDLSESLIPDKGRLLKCGSCDQTWFFNKKNSTNTNIDIDITSSIDTKTIENYKPFKKKKNDLRVRSDSAAMKVVEGTARSMGVDIIEG